MREPNYELSRDMDYAFSWGSTPEGNPFWNRVYEFLRGESELPTAPDGEIAPENYSSVMVYDRERLCKVRDYFATDPLWFDIHARLSAIVQSDIPRINSLLISKYLDPLDRDATIANLEKAGAEFIGSGCFGRVYVFPGHPDVVIKISLRGQSVRDGWIPFARSVLDFGRNNPHLPRIYALMQFGQPRASDSFYVAVMERLYVRGGGSLDYSAPVVGDVSAATALSICREYLTASRGTEPSSIRKLPPALVSALDMIRANADGFAIDLHSGNVMFRGDTFVIIDPFSVNPSKKSSR